GTLVYSTCTFAPEENESVIDWVLRKLPGQIEVQPVELPGIMNYPSLLEWEKRMYDSRVQQCFRVLPTSSMEGFFITKLTRV
ncbi:MAG: RsmB/NOP family class I SAM-dependent RNA methyltransferase, partial [Candidatus Omnitrophica bacterium]|nr:RsmB/NOP family class I SAM-dependent RNA methyltransferase [Candidatus Omnitrophota bacterium]